MFVFIYMSEFGDGVMSQYHSQHIVPTVNSNPAKDTVPPQIAYLEGLRSCTWYSDEL